MRAGVERLNDSILTYIWAVLGSQAQTRTGILGAGTAFDAQKQFIAGIEDVISSPVDLPLAIKRYQVILQYACTVVNYTFGTGLYMAPGDKLLWVGQVVGYNNQIVIATPGESLGLNLGINTSDAPANAENYTGEEGLVQPPEGTFSQPLGSSSTDQAHQKAAANQHSDEKTALIVGGITLGLAVLWSAR